MIPGNYYCRYKSGPVSWGICEVIGDYFCLIGYGGRELVDDDRWEFGPRIPEFDPNEKAPPLYSTERDRLIAWNVVGVAVEELHPDWSSEDKEDAVVALLERAGVDVSLPIAIPIEKFAAFAKDVLDSLGEDGWCTQDLRKDALECGLIHHVFKDGSFEFAPGWPTMEGEQ